MSATYVGVQDLSILYTNEYCATAVFALLVYDWLLCIDQEVKFIWNWRTRGVTISSVVYALSRYALITEFSLMVATIYPMSDLSCKVNIWGQVALQILSLIAFSTFSALRAYALSNRSTWLATIIILLALPPAVMCIVQQVYLSPENLPSPLNCNPSSSISSALIFSVDIITRGSQLVAELLVVGITWWYTYQSYRIQKGLNLGKTVSSLLFYNGSMYFLFLATLYIFDFISFSASVPVVIQAMGKFLELFIDPLASILTCRFMLSLRRFDSTVMSATASGLGPQLREHMASTVLPFGARPSDSLPPLIASFSHPVHVNVPLSETDAEAAVEDASESRDLVASILLETSSGRNLACEKTSNSEPCA